MTLSLFYIQLRLTLFLPDDDWLNGDSRRESSNLELNENVAVRVRPLRTDEDLKTVKETI
jgi:hypothetical protein